MDFSLLVKLEWSHIQILNGFAGSYMQAAEDSLARKRPEAIVSAAVALAAVVSGESPFVHVDSIQACFGIALIACRCAMRQTCSPCHLLMRGMTHQREACHPAKLIMGFAGKGG